MPLMLYTTNYVPGHKIDRTFGLVYGITVRSRGLGRNVTAGLRSIAGGEITEYTDLAHDSRQQSLDRLMEQARTLGANAVIGVLFDSSSIGQTMNEIIAFGTAVIVSPVTEERQLVELS